jgi:hypothetical protein
MADLDTKFKIRQASSQLVPIALAKNILLTNVFEMADREVDGTPSCESTNPFGGHCVGLMDDQRITRSFAQTPF